MVEALPGSYSWAVCRPSGGLPAEEPVCQTAWDGSRGTLVKPDHTAATPHRWGGAGTHGSCRVRTIKHGMSHHVSGQLCRLSEVGWEGRGSGHALVIF